MDPRQLKGPQRYLNCELLEFSFVSVPAVREATVVERSYRGRSWPASLAARQAAVRRLAPPAGAGLDAVAFNDPAGFALWHQRATCAALPAPQTKAQRLALVERLKA